MKKSFLVVLAFICALTASAQTKLKGMKELRDSMFTVMKLSDESRKAMHDVIAESGKGQKAIREDATLNDVQKKEKLAEFLKSMRTKELEILTPEQVKAWKEFTAELREKQKAKSN